MSVEKAGVEIQTWDAALQAKIRETPYGQARDAYLDLAGEEGKKLLAIYEKEHERIVV